MRKDIKRLLERSSYAISIFITVLIIYLSLAPTANIMESVQISDKSLHGFAYFVLTLSWLFAFKNSHDTVKMKALVGFSILVLGMLLEYLQGEITDYRTSDYLDIVANAFGIVIAIISFRNLLRFYNAI